MYTKRQALELAMEMWYWLADHPSKNKDTWPRWKENGGDLTEALTYCFFCDYVFNTLPKGTATCNKNCPLTGLWSEHGCTSCTSAGETIYDKWRPGSVDATYYATMIADLCASVLYMEYGEIITQEEKIYNEK